MDDSSLFRQKAPGSVPQGQDQQAVDATPSEQSGTNVRIGTPVWRSFVQNKQFQEQNKASIQAEQNQMRAAAVDNRRASTIERPPMFKGVNGKLLRVQGGRGEELNPEEWANDPEVGPLARKSLWEREIGSAKKESADASFRLKDPSFHAKGRTDKRREEIAMELGGMARQIGPNYEADPGYTALKRELIDDDQYREEKKTLAQRSYDSEARARQLESTDPETWWQSRGQPTAKDTQAAAVAQTQAGRAEVQAADNSAAEEERQLRAELAQGVKGPDVAAKQARLAEIAAARGRIAQEAVKAEEPVKAVQAAAQAKQEGVGDFLRGAEVSVKQVPQLAYGVAGLIGETLEKTVGVGASLRDWGFKGYKEAEEKAAPLQRENDDVTKAWEKAKTGDVGALVDWAQYGLGYALGQAAESVAVAVGGAVVGGMASAPSGPGAAVGAGGGAVAGLVAKGAVKTAAKTLIEKAISGQAMKIAAKQLGKDATEDAIIKQAASKAVRKAAGARLGQLIAVGGNSLAMELGSIYPEAVAQAEAEGRTLTGTDIARIWGSGVAAGALEGATDMLGLDLVTGKLKGMLPDGRIAAGAIAGLAGIVTEGGTEVAQTGIERFGAGKAVTGDEAANEYINAGALGALGGGVIGGAGGAIGGGTPPVAPDGTPADITPEINTALAAIDPELPPATPEEIAAARMIANPDDGAQGLAESVLIERELLEAERIEAEEYAAADEAIAQATLAGDKGALKVAEEARDKLPTHRADAVRAILKIISGADPRRLTPKQLTAIGLKTGASGELEVQTDEELKKNGLTETLVYAELETGFPIVTDEGLQRVAAVSPTAGQRPKMTQEQAAENARQRAADLAAEQLSTDTPDGAQGDPATGPLLPSEIQGAVEFDVPMRDGTVLRVQAPDAETALAEAADVAPITGQPATPVPNVANPQGLPQGEIQPPTQVPVSPLPVGTPPPADAGTVGGNAETAPPAETQAEAPVATSPGTRALIRAKASIAKAKKAPKLAAILKVSTDPADRAEAKPDGTITINPERVINEALRGGMAPDKVPDYFDRVLDEEIRHAAQYDAAKTLWKLSNSKLDLATWREQYYAGIWASDFSGKKGDYARDLYTRKDPANLEKWKFMSDGNKAMEAIRIMSQDQVTEEAIFLWTDISDALRTALKAALASLKKLATSPALKAEITNLENALRTLTGTPDTGPTTPGNPQPQPGRKNPDAGDRPTAEKKRREPPPVGGRTGAARRDPSGSPALVVGARVEFEWRGRTLTGKVRLAQNGAVSIYPDEKPDVAVGPVAAKDVRVIEADTKTPETPANEVMAGNSSDISVDNAIAELRDTGVTYFQDARFAILQGDDTQFYVLKTVGGKQQPVTSWYSSIERAQQDAIRQISVMAAGEAQTTSEAIITQSTNSLEKSIWKPNHVVFEAISFPDYERMGYVQVPHDGTPEGMARAAKQAEEQSNNALGETSHSGSRAVATDANGKPAFFVSPNGKVNPIDSPEARYSAGDLNAFKDDSLKRILAAQEAGDIETVNRLAQERIDEIEARLAEIGHDESKPVESLSITGQSIRRSVLRDRDEIAKWESLMVKDATAPKGQADPKVAKPAKKRRAVTDTPARRKAFEILRGNRLGIISKVIGEVGRITAPPRELALINAKRKRKEKLTAKELATWEANQQYNAYLAKNAFGNDFWGKVAQELHGMIFVRGAGQAPDTAAEAIDKFMTPDTLLREIMGELNEVASGMPGDNDQNSPEFELSPEQERSMIAFDEANQEELGTIGVEAGDLDPSGNEVFVIAGENFRVLANRDGMVTLEDGPKFGTQRMPENSVLWIKDDMFLPEEVIQALGEQLVDESERKGYESVDELAESAPESIEGKIVGATENGGNASGAAGRSPAQGAEDRAGAVTPLTPDEQALKDAFAGMEDLDSVPAAAAPSFEALDALDLIRKWGDKWQYKMRVGGSWYYANSKEGAMESATTAYNATPEAERKTRQQLDAEADAVYDAKSEELFKGKSKADLEKDLQIITRNIAQLQSAGLREFGGNGGRRTGPATNNEAARVAGEHKMRIERYLREKFAEPATPVKPALTSKMDIRNADSKELFADDGGFKLGQDSTVDGAKVVAARQAKEDAKAAMDAAQGDIFAQPKAPAKPALTADEQALKDAFSGMVDGLEAAPLVADDFYQSKGIPRDKRALFMDVADQLYDAGVRTPQDLAAKLEKVGGGKLRAYSDAVWSVLRSNYPTLPQSSDWSGIYSKINDTTPNDTTPGTPLESDRGNAGASDGSGKAGVQNGRGSARGSGKRVVSGGNQGGNPSPDRIQPTDNPATSQGGGRDQQSPDASSEPAERPAKPENADGSRVPDASGVEAYGRGENDTHDSLIIPAVAGSLAQGGIENLRDVAGVKKSAPALKVEQAEDVVFVEKRFEKEPGALLTNGTGTGKTFSGLGVIKRALDRGEKHVIIVAPSDKVVNDWIDTAREFFGITDIGQLDGIRDNSAPNRVVVTTYANFGQNNELVRRPWGLVVTDEAHYLSQAKDGNSTLAQKTFKGLTWHPKEGVGNRISMEMAEELEEMSTLRKSITGNDRLMNRDDTMDQARDAYRRENIQLEARFNTLNGKVQARREELNKRSAAMKKEERPKTLFLSATPFAYHFSLDYAEGYLFEHGPEPTSRRYNTPSARSKFYMENFGYRMRYGKLTQPENAAASVILERMFAEKLKRSGAMRGRMLSVPFDYSRDFVLSESAVGNKIDEVIKAMNDNPKFGVVRPYLEIGDYLKRRYLLEGIKAKESIQRIKEHLALGRKVLVFHDYKKGGASNPFRSTFIPRDTSVLVKIGDKNVEVNLMEAYEEMAATIPGFNEFLTELDGLLSPIDAITRALPGAGIFNGDVPASKRAQIVKEFNRSGSPMNIVLAQRASAKEGISFHDTDGKHQRAFIDIGIAGRPTDAIQGEGRTIRLGMQSNGIIEYLTTGTDFERYTFAQTIATRASTAENLAMGDNARALLQAFAQGYNNAQALKPSQTQGTGGKQSDAARESGDPFDNAVALYFTNQKKNSRNKAEEGVDYFATPEPLGFKMVEWAGIRPGERVLEPSAGHGAIARFFPDSTTRHAVEPSYELAGRLALNAPDTRVHQVQFEDYDVINKFDVVVMNPPFGTAGKTAMDHLEKAVKHLKDGGRVVALIPNGSSMAKRFDKWYETVEGVFMAAEIQLPSVTFERAGTSVSARIVILDKVKADAANQQSNRDFTSAGTTKELFERLKESTVPDRPAPAVEKTPAQMMADLLNDGREGKAPKVEKPQGIDGAFSAADFVHTQKGTSVMVARIDNKLSDSEYAAAKTLAKKHGGYYSSYNKGGAIPGFHFPDSESRDAFLGEAATPKAEPLRAAEIPPAQKKQISRLQQVIDAKYESGKLNGIEDLEAKLETLLENAETNLDGMDEGTDEGAGGQLPNSDAALPSPESDLIEAWYRWTGKGEINARDAADFRKEYANFGKFYRSAIGDGAFAISERVTDAQIEDAAQDAAANYERRRNAMKLTAASPEWQAMSKEQRMAYLKGQKDGLRAAEIPPAASGDDIAIPNRIPFRNAQELPMSAVNVLHSNSRYLPKPIRKIKNPHVASNLADIALRTWGRKITSNDITPEEQELITQMGVDEFVAAYNASGKSAANWYSTSVDAAMAVAGVIHPEIVNDAEAAKLPVFANQANPARAADLVMRIAMAVTSQNLSVPLNSRFAEEQFNIFKTTGRFDSSKVYGEKAESISSNLELANQLIEAVGFDEARAFIDEEFTVRDLKTILQKILGRNINIAGKMDDVLNGAAMFGPKIGQGFLQNLMGKFSPVTIDLWMRRTWGRWSGDVVGRGADGERLARMLDGAREYGIPVAELKEVRVVDRYRKGGSLFRTVNDATENRLETDFDFANKVLAVARRMHALGQKHYKLTKQPIDKQTLADLDSGGITYKEFIRRQLRNSARAEQAFAIAKTKTKGLKKSEFVAQWMTDNDLTQKHPDPGSLKPEWSRSAAVIVNALKPIDVPGPQDRRLITQIVNDIRERLTAMGYDTTNADIQAILWYPEKDLWAKLRGEDESNLKNSYDEEFIKIAESRGLGAEARRVADAILSRGSGTSRSGILADQGTDGATGEGITQPAQSATAPLRPLRAATIPESLPTLRQRGRAEFAKAKPLIESAEAQMAAFGPGSMGVDPKFANFGGSNQDSRNQVDIVRAYDTFNREVRADRDTFARAKEYLTKDPAGVEELALRAYSGGGQMQILDHQQLAIEMFIQQRLASSGDNRQAQIDNFVLIQANIINRREGARTLRMGYDKFMTPEERAHQQLADAIFRLHPKVEARAKTMTLSERKAFLAEAGEARIAEVEKQLQKLNLRISQVIGKNRALQLENSRMMKEVLKTRDLMDQKILKAVQKGATLADIKRTLGKDAAAKAQEVATKARAELFEKIKRMSDSGMSRDAIREAMKDSLKAAPLGGAANGMSDADIWNMIAEDFGIAETIPERPLPTAKPKKAKAEMTAAEIEEAETSAMEKVAKRWMEKLATSQSDTLSWGAKAQANLNAMEALIREHVKTGVKDFRQKAEDLGATPQQSFVIDKEAVEERRRKELIRTTRRTLAQEKADAALAARNTPEAIAKRWIDKYAISQSDTQAWGKGGKKADEVSKLIKAHLKTPMPDFIDRAIALGVTAEQARVLNGEIMQERSILAQIKESRRIAAQKQANPLSSNWARPEFTDGMNAYTFDTKDRAGIMERVEIIRGLAGAMGKIDGLEGQKRIQAMAKLAEINAILKKYGTDAAGIFTASQGIESYGFDITDIAHVAAVARAINAIDADAVDKATEYFYASLLSGLQTMLVNATAVVPAVWEATVGRGVSMAVNSLLKTVNLDSAMAEQVGESKYMLKALAPAITRAMSNFQASMAAQHPMFDRDVNAMEVDWDKILGGGSHKMIGSITGRKGDIIRLPMRLLAATDDFNRTLMACCEVGAFAYRIAKAKGMKPGSPEMDKFIRQEVNTPGSFSYQLASKKASSAIYSNPLPGQNDPYTKKPVPVRDLGDVIGFVAGKITDAVAKEHENLLLKAVAAAFRISFFPFQRTPFNIIRKGIRHTLNPFSLFDIGLGIVANGQSRNPDGTTKWDWKITGDSQESHDRRIHRAELIERMGQQLQGAVLMTLLVAASAGEGDEDDMEKPFVITGSLPFLPTNMAERDARMRSGIGAYRISFRRGDGSERFGFSYGRMEPVATLLSATIDTVKSVKRSYRAGGGSYDAAAAALGGFASQAQDKTFMRGVGDLIGLTKNIVAEPDIKENRKALQFLAGRVAMVVPNIIKQPIREADPQFRDRSDGFMQELLYQAAPAGQKPAKVDPYGDKLTKTGNSVGRIIDVADTGTDKVNPIDRMLVKWSDSGEWSKAENPSDRKPWFPAPIMNAEFKHRVTGQSVKMNGEQLAEFREMAGKRAIALLKLKKLNMDAPTARDVEIVKDSISQARSEMKKMLAFKFSK